MKLTPHLRFLFRNLHNPDSEPSLDWFAMRLEKQGIFLNNHLFSFTIGFSPHSFSKTAKTNIILTRKTFPSQL